MPRAGQPAGDHFAGGIKPGSDVLADTLAAVTRQLRTIAGGAAIRVLVVKEVAVGHGAAVGFSGTAQGGIPGQRRGGGKGLITALTRGAARTVELLKQLLPFRLPVAQACGEQRSSQQNTPLAALLIDADIDKLRVQHNRAEALPQHGQRRRRVTRTGQADGLHVDHRVAGGAHRLLQIPRASYRLHQAWICRQRRQLGRSLLATPLHFAAVAVDQPNQLRVLGGLCTRSAQQRQPRGDDRPNKTLASHNPPRPEQAHWHAHQCVRVILAHLAR